MYERRLRSCKGYIIGAGLAARGNQDGQASGIISIYNEHENQVE
jgi:hypothetical protein